MPPPRGSATHPRQPRSPARPGTPGDSATTTARSHRQLRPLAMPGTTKSPRPSQHRTHPLGTGCNTAQACKANTTLKKKKNKNHVDWKDITTIPTSPSLHVHLCMHNQAPPPHRLPRSPDHAGSPSITAHMVAAAPRETHTSDSATHQEFLPSRGGHRTNGHPIPLVGPNTLPSPVAHRGTEDTAILHGE